MYSRFKDNIGAEDLAEVWLLSSKNWGVIIMYDRCFQQICLD